MSSDTEKNDRELQRLLDEINKQQEENHDENESQTKMRMSYEKEIADEIAAAKAALDAGNIDDARMHQIRASNANAALKGWHKFSKT